MLKFFLLHRSLHFNLEGQNLLDVLSYLYDVTICGLL